MTRCYELSEGKLVVYMQKQSAQLHLFHLQYKMIPLSKAELS